MTRRDLQGVLAWSALPGVGERTLLALLDHAREGRRSPADLWEMPLADLHALVPLHPRARAARERDAAERWEQAGTDAAEVEAWGVDLLLAGQPDAPAILRSPRRRPYLFAFGALGLLEEPRVALLNSRDVSHPGLVVTDALADALARRDVALVASINRDSYKAAATAAKRHAGPSVLALDRGIATVFHSGIEREPVAPARVWDESFDPDLQLLLSACGWREPWHPRSGPARDELIADLADLIVAVDVRPGGTIEQECLRAAREGKPVLAVDRGSEAVSRLWEMSPEIERLPWKGAEEAVARVLARPGESPELREEGARHGRLRDVAAFLARACARISESRGPAVGAHPATGVLAEVAAAWGAPGSNATAGHDWLLADLSGETVPARLTQLLERVRKGGCLAALVPTAWLDGEHHAAARQAWLRQAALRLTIRLPQANGNENTDPVAAVLLRRGDEADQPVHAFAPQPERMGRFHLRRYLQEVLRSL